MFNVTRHTYTHTRQCSRRRDRRKTPEKKWAQPTQPFVRYCSSPARLSLNLKSCCATLGRGRGETRGAKRHDIRRAGCPRGGRQEYAWVCARRRAPYLHGPDQTTLDRRACVRALRACICARVCGGWCRPECATDIRSRKGRAEERPARVGAGCPPVLRRRGGGRVCGGSATHKLNDIYRVRDILLPVHHPPDMRRRRQGTTTSFDEKRKKIP